MRTQRVTIDNGRGDKLSARFDRPERDNPRAVALFAHCFTCSKNLRAATEVSRALLAEGWAVLRFDFTGLGASEGEFADTTFSSNVGDLVATASWLRDQSCAPDLLIGHSLGGAAVLRAAAQVPSVRAVATIGAPCDPTHVEALLAPAREEIERRGEAEVVLAGRTFRIKREFLDDLAEHTMRQAIGDLKRALLIMHAPRDETVGIDNATRIFVAAKHPKSFVSLDDADHLLTRPEDAHFAARVIASWSERYLAPAAPSEDEELVTVWGPERGFRCDIEAGGHAGVADEPESFGGTNTGPSPYGHLLSGLGACTAMTLRLYADRKKWPLQQAVVRLRHGKVHAKDCSDCGDGKTVKIDQIDRTLELRGDLDDEQRRRLTDIADKCPVHRTLESKVRIVTSLQDTDT